MGFNGVLASGYDYSLTMVLLWFYRDMSIVNGILTMVYIGMIIWEEV